MFHGEQESAAAGHHTAIARGAGQDPDTKSPRLTGGGSLRCPIDPDYGFESVSWKKLGVLAEKFTRLM
jgi:hypothetical protein